MEFCKCEYKKGNYHWYRSYCCNCDKLFCGNAIEVCIELKILNNTHNQTYICKNCDKKIIVQSMKTRSISI